jgi:antitoxin (DNA-binding transcriptional repressor) of toxin-antitoxin stability system
MCHNEDMKKAARRGKKFSVAETSAKRAQSGNHAGTTSATIGHFTPEGRGAVRKASVRDLHMRTGALVQEAAEGEVIVIEKRGKPVAELRGIARKRSIGDAFREMERAGYFAKLGKTSSNIDRYISEDRDR